MLVGEGVTEIQLAYIAGILDGEGTCVIGKYARDNREMAYRGYMAIANTYLPVLEWIQTRLGGKIALQVKTNGPYAGSRCYSLTFSANEIRRVLPRLLPYLVIKRKQAEVLLSFLARQENNASAPIAIGVLAFYEECYVQLKQLKKERFEYRRPPVRYSEQACCQCGVMFQNSSQTPRRKYCSGWCKRKTHWVRSNARIRDGVPAWSSLQRGVVPESSTSRN